jgi:hypothetical protein
VAIPIVSVRTSASTDATIIRVSGLTFIETVTGVSRGNPHTFDGTSLSNTYLSTPVQKFANVFSVRLGRDLFMGREFGEKRREVGFGELPFERFGG